MTMMRWEPFREMMSLRNAMDRLFDESFIHPSPFWPEIGAGNVPLDIYQTDKNLIVKATLPGVKPEEVDISLSGDSVTIKGEHKEEQESKEENYFRREIKYGSFNRTARLPVPIKSDKAEATFDDGVLTLTLPKAEESRPKKINIKPKAMIEGKKK